MAAKKKKAAAAKKSVAKSAGAKKPFAKAKAAMSKAGKAVNKAVNNAKKAIKKATGPQAIPDGFHTLTPSIVVAGAKEAMEFYKKAFGATQHGGVMAGPDGKIMHAEMKIGDSLFMLSDEFPDMGSKGPKTLGGTSASIMIYSKDADAVYNRALAAGATVSMPIGDMFWGDRYGRVLDPFGHDWQIATHKEDLTPEQMQERMMKAGPPPSA